MKVCIYGAGAIGGFLGARLALRGHETSAVARGATLDALLRHGWRFETAQDGLRTAPVSASESADRLGEQDLVVVAVKGPALAAVARGITPLLGPRTRVLTAMNGVPWWFFDGFGGPLAGTRLDTLDPDGEIAAAIPSRQVVGCVVHATCSTPEPGWVRHGFGQGLVIGEPGGADSTALQPLAGALADAGFEVRVSSCIQQDVWYKLWGNMTMNPVSALTGATCDRILDDELVRGFVLRVMAEARAIGARIGCAIEQSGEDRNAVTRKLGAFKTSMLQDVEAGRAIELDALVGAVREIGGLLQHPTPDLDALLGLTRLMARTRRLYPD